MLINDLSLPFFPDQSTFYGVYETRVSTLALCHILSHYVATGDHRLGNITVEEEVIQSLSAGMISLPLLCF